MDLKSGLQRLAASAKAQGLWSTSALAVLALARIEELECEALLFREGKQRSARAGGLAKSAKASVSKPSTAQFP